MALKHEKMLRCTYKKRNGNESYTVIPVLTYQSTNVETAIDLAGSVQQQAMSWCQNGIENSGRMNNFTVENLSYGLTCTHTT